MPNLERKLKKLALKYAGSIARLSSQSNLLTIPSPRQDRLFVPACLESWIHHLLQNPQIDPEIPRLRTFPLTWSDLQKQLHFFSDREFIVHPVDNKTLNYSEKILLRSGANLHLKTNERVNNLYLYAPQGEDWSETIYLKARMLSRTRRNYYSDLNNFGEIYHKIYTEDQSSVRLWGTVQQFQNLILQNLHLQPLPQNSRIFIFQNKLSPAIDNLRADLASLFALSIERIHYFCADKDLQAIFFTCKCGCWHMPVTYRLCDGLFYNPCVKHRPILAKETYYRLNYNYFCPCRLNAPVIEWQVSEN